MPRAKISEFSTTAGDNTDIDGINIGEGCAPSGINDAIRELMAQLKDFQSGAAGDNITVVGTLAAKGTSASGADLKLYEDTDNGTNYVGFMAPASIASNVQWTLPGADGSANQVLQTNGSGVLSFATAATGDVTQAGNNAFTGANTFFNATGQTFGTATSTQDGFLVTGRAGGSSSYRVTFTPGTLSATRTVTFPDATGTAVLDTATQTLTNKTVEAGTFTNGYTEKTVTANTGTAYTIDLANGTVQILTLTGNCTFTFPTATAGRSFILLLKQDGTGSRTVTWPAAVKWPGSTAPTITSTASRCDKYIFTADNNSNWIASNAGQNYTV